MFIGHYAPAFVAAAIAAREDQGAKRRIGLGTMFIAAQLVDYGFFGLALAGIEKMRISPGIAVMNAMDLYHYPYTHSLVGTSLWAAGFGLLVMLFGGNRRGALLAALVVVSHWFLDLVVHVPDLTLHGHDPTLGLGLWNHPAIEIPLELALCFGAFLYYIMATRPDQASAKSAWIAPLVLAVTLLALQLYNWFGPQPEAYDPAIAVTSLFAYTLLTALALWAARGRTVR
ncbi:hypothetical protein [Alterisphingorhabdus coralli]|uniref:Metal-dependent hydrolase n=1 Tax=Alterisphingorhabdus coralli TaxID=3071408 RepID=A0AA97FBE7_9SPHN|nr:hypothetical protein [Parasphingorhabdus sp. SCSIO 66989]WOE75970.1 hypothetical protein RB602_04430 [Parasphingorhabdus sp. SCSIO 66989]